MSQASLQEEGRRRLSAEEEEVGGRGAEVGVMWPEGCRQPPDARRGEHRALPTSLQRNQLCRHLDFSSMKLMLDFRPLRL